MSNAEDSFCGIGYTLKKLLPPSYKLSLPLHEPLSPPIPSQCQKKKKPLSDLTSLYVQLLNPSPFPPYPPFLPVPPKQRQCYFTGRESKDIASALTSLASYALLERRYWIGWEREEVCGDEW